MKTRSILEDLYQEHYQGLFLFVVKTVKREDYARDLVQDVFLLLHRELEKGRQFDKTKAWLYRVAYNKCMDFYRNDNLQVNLDNLQEEEVPENPQEITQGESVLDCLTELPSHDQALLLLYAENLSYKEISEITGLKFTSVGKTIARSIQKLKKIVLTHELSSTR